MPNLSASQTAVLRSIFGAAPDGAVCSLEQALRGEATRGGPMAGVYELVAHEAAERKVRSAVFAPLIRLCAHAPGSAIRFPSAVIPLLWSAVRMAEPGLAQSAMVFSAQKTESPQAVECYNQLCMAAAAGLRLEADEFVVAVDCLNRRQPGGAGQFASFLDLVPLARGTLARLPEWVGRMTEERAAAARVAYKDAVELADDAGPRFFELLHANLTEPWLILRLLSAVMDRPTDSYVAVSELARFGGYILEDIDRRLESFSKFDASGGRPAGVAAADLLHAAALEIAEFETALELSREGPWGRRVMVQKQRLAQLAETRLAHVEKALDSALPQQAVRFGKGLRGQPRLTTDPDPTAIGKAAGMLAFAEHSRAAANQAGYGATRTRTLEKAEARIGQYVEDLLEYLRTEPVEHPERARAFLEAAATLAEIAQGEKAGQIVRRRAAAA
jgi:hypothetical protein